MRLVIKTDSFILALLARGAPAATSHATEYDAWSPAGSPALDCGAAVAVALADGRALRGPAATASRGNSDRPTGGRRAL